MSPSIVIRRLLAIALALFALEAAAQLGTITTVAGGGAGDGLPAMSVPLSDAVSYIATDNSGNVYFTEGSAAVPARIHKVTPQGIHTSFAGGGAGGDGGLATAAALGLVRGMGFDSAGNLYFADGLRIRKIDPAGVITTIAGNASVPDTRGDGGPAIDATFASPSCLSVDAAGNIYICDSFRVRRITPDGIIRTVAGGGSVTAGIDIPATNGFYYGPNGLVADEAGGFYFTEGLGRVYHVGADGIVHVAAGSGLAAAWALARDSAGNVYICEEQQNRVLKYTPGSASLQVVAGTGIRAYSGDGGPATAAGLFCFNGLAVAVSGAVYLSEGRIRRIDTAGIIDAFAGSDSHAFPDGTVATNASLSYRPLNLRADPAGGFAFLQSSAVRAVTSGGLLATPPLPGVVSYTRDPSGNWYYTTTTGDYRIMKRDAAGNVALFAGTGINGFSGDGGPATLAKISYPSSLASDAWGNLYFLDGLHRVRKVDTAGNISTVAGNGLTGFSSEGALATATTIWADTIALDGQGNLFMSLPGAPIHKVDTAGVITTFANISAYGIAADPQGNLYAANRAGYVVNKIDPAGNVTVLAGTGVVGFSGDGGPATAAQLLDPIAVEWHPQGYLLVSDYFRVRRIELGDTIPNSFSFLSVSGVALASVIQSDTVTPSGYDQPTGIFVTNGEYSIGCNGTFTNAAATINPGQSVCVRHTSSSIGNADVVTTLTIGTVRATFQSTTMPVTGTITTNPATTLDLGAQSMLTTSFAGTITLTNAGASTVYVNGATTTGAFAVQQSCGAIAPGASCTAQVTFTPDNVGTLSGTVVFQNSPGNQTIALTGTGERSLTIHYYRSIMRRDPDSSGKAYWDGEAVRVTNLGANVNEAWYNLATAFYFSPEYLAYQRTPPEYLTDLYRTFFNRAPDSGGLAFWQDQMTQGLPRESVLASFMLSPEFTTFSARIFGPGSARAEVDVVMDFYRGFLARLPDDGGFSYWVTRFRTAQCASNPATAIAQEADAISGLFASSAEYLQRSRTNGQYVSDLYNAFERRGAELGGFKYWVGYLDSNSVTRETVRAAFRDSVEFRARIARVVQQGCLH